MILLTRCLFLVVLLQSTLLFAQKSFHDKLLADMESMADYYGSKSEELWKYAELGYQEERSVALCKSELKKNGFAIDDAVAGIPTAFIASYGSGEPVIGIVGEYDALPGLSQAAVAVRQVGDYGTSGHGCGHNLLGAAALYAAVASKNYMEENGIKGTLRFYGTPAEEGGSGKYYMMRDDAAFKDCDVVLAWHPGDRNTASWQQCLAVITAKFRFSGIASHAAAAPDKGRSALDGLMLTTQAVEMLREHIPSESRLHYIVSKGGKAPNVVPDETELYMYARHPDMRVLLGIWDRIEKCAEGAALATETSVEVEIVSSAYNFLNLNTVNTMLLENLKKVGGVEYSPEEAAFAKEIQQTLPKAARKSLSSSREILPIEQAVVTASSDIGDVSWNVPTGHLWAATLVPGVSLHTWQSTACSGTSIGRKGMVVAAKTLALTAVELFQSPGQLAEIDAEFRQKLGDFTYQSLIPDSKSAPLNYRE